MSYNSNVTHTSQDAKHKTLLKVQFYKLACMEYLFLVSVRRTTHSRVWGHNQRYSHHPKRSPNSTSLVS